MVAVVSHRVKAAPKDKLPPGAAEAEFAYLKAASIRRGEDHPFEHAYYLEKRDLEVLIPGVVQRQARLNKLRGPKRERK
ncbi:hypothetical protein ABIB06_006568 [Bradyrhizobium sp. LB8.2]